MEVAYGLKMATNSLPVSHQEVGLCLSLNLGWPVTVQTKAAWWKQRCVCLYACLSERTGSFLLGLREPCTVTRSLTTLLVR